MALVLRSGIAKGPPVMVTDCAAAIAMVRVAAGRRREYRDELVGLLEIVALEPELVAEGSALIVTLPL